VKSLHICIYNIISIEEVGEQAEGLKFQNDKSKLLLLNPSESSGPAGPSGPSVQS
jgi:hypothetical protein